MCDEKYDEVMCDEETYGDWTDDEVTADVVTGAELPGACPEPGVGPAGPDK